MILKLLTPTIVVLANSFFYPINGGAAVSHASGRAARIEALIPRNVSISGGPSFIGPATEDPKASGGSVDLRALSGGRRDPRREFGGPGIPRRVDAPPRRSYATLHRQSDGRQGDADEEEDHYCRQLVEAKVCEENRAKNRSCSTTAGAFDSTDGVRAAVILPRNDSFLVSFNKVYPVLLMAEMEVQDRQLLPFRIHFFQKEDRCDNIYAAYEASNARYFESVHVFFGPMCEYSTASVGRFLKFWKRPLLTAGAVSFDFSANKTAPDSEFHMLLRVGLLSFRPISNFIVKIFEDWNWRKAVLLYEKNGYSNLFGPNTCHLMMSTLIELEFKPRKQNGTFDYHYYDLESGKPNAIKDDLRESVHNKSTRRIHASLIRCTRCHDSSARKFQHRRSRRGEIWLIDNQMISMPGFSLLSNVERS